MKIAILQSRLVATMTLGFLLSACVPQVIRFAGPDVDSGVPPRFEHVKFVTIDDQLSLPGLYKSTSGQDNVRRERVWQARLRAYDQAWEPIRAAFPNATLIIQSRRERVVLPRQSPQQTPVLDEEAVRVSVRSGSSSANPIVYSCVLTMFTLGIVPCYGSHTDTIYYDLSFLGSAAGTPGRKDQYDSTARYFGGWLIAAVLLELDEVLIPSDLPESVASFEKRMVGIRDLNRRFLQDATPLLIRYDRLAEQAAAKATR